MKLGTRQIGSSALLSLQIIQSESHPNVFNQGPGTKSASGKEGLSVYGLFHRFAHTPQGRAKLKQIFFRPSVDLDTIRTRHDFVGVFSRPDNTAALEKITKGLKRITNLRPVMINLHKGISTGSAKITGFKTTVWASLLAVCTSYEIYAPADTITSSHSIQSTSMMRCEKSQVQTCCLCEQRFDLSFPSMSSQLKLDRLFKPLKLPSYTEWDE